MKIRTFFSSMSHVRFQQLGMLFVLIIMCTIFSIILPDFLQISNILNVLKQISVIAILAAGVTFVILTGGIDLSVGSVLALAGVISVLLSKQGINSVVAMLSGILVGALAGLVNGFLVARVRLSPFIVTLGSLTYVRGLAYVISGGYPIALQSDLFKTAGAGTFLSIPIPIYIMLIVYLLSFFILKYTMFGRNVYAIGGNEEAAHLSGIKVNQNLILVYTLSGLLAGLGGIVLAGRLFSGQPTAGQGFELDAIAAVILGGTSLTGGVGTIQGTIIGALIMGVLSNALTLMNVDYYWQQVVKGVVIVLAVLIDRLRKKDK
ncbi:ABC transporter permease [Thermoflavimicrobium dichotomicum]|uniref:Ribose transport system permease protein n=1 Tax=Thermoflavimicrobium dichotomicum TaxID=46223 RepID=A0A1I3V2V9_9BACL|nr:ribose ABC transporter permease [Thermoflavimicrobium dichotomicum]SFJ88696.1 ribose transport system permease protein [Thermoflavimicrobium dichotomicum]